MEELSSLGSSRRLTLQGFVRGSAIRNPRDCQALGVPNFSCEAAFLLDAMAALPRKSDPGGAASLPWIRGIAIRDKII